MSDNPLADWLREGGPWSPDEQDVDEPPTALGPAPPAWQSPAERPDDPAGVAEQATAPFGDWDDDPAPRASRPRRLLLLGLAVVPWLGFAAVALATFGGTDATPDGDSAQEADAAEAGDSAEAADAAEAGDSAEAADAAEAGDAPTVDDPAGRAGAERRAGAAASVAVRTALTGEVPGAGGAVRYVDLAMVESLEWVGDVAVVGVAAVVLESAGETWGEARPARFAVPVRVTEAGAVPVADPWPLPDVAEGEPPVWEPVADEDLAAAAARVLTEAGYDEVAEITAHRSEGVPDVLAVDVLAVAPGSTRTTAHRVWLRDADPPSLLPDGEPSPLPAEPPRPLPADPSP